MRFTWTGPAGLFHRRMLCQAAPATMAQATECYTMDQELQLPVQTSPRIAAQMVG
jgi:hypothetical protein